MNVLSLFDGISCGLVALKRIGVKVDNYFASEIDENAIAISKKNHPEIIRLGDVIKWREWDLPRIDLVLAGSPCQGFSRNGKMLNFKDSRSKLFFTFIDILTYVQSKNPYVHFLLENVEMKKEWVELIDRYTDTTGFLLNSNLFSAQNRPRMYWTDIPVKKPVDKGITLESILCNPTIVYELVNDVFFDKRISESERSLIYRSGGRVAVKQATKSGFIIADPGDGINLQFPTSKTRRGRVIRKKSPTLDCQCNICVCVNDKIRKLEVVELERLQTLPDHYTYGFSESIAKKAIGNGWTVDVIAYILRGLERCHISKQ